MPVWVTRESVRQRTRPRRPRDGPGRRTMYEDVRWFPGVPGALAGLTPR